MDIREYAKGAVFTLPLIDITGSQDFEVGMTFAAGDAKMVSNKQGSTNLTCEFAAFTSGDTEPNSGDSITGGTSTETAIVIGVVLTSGSWSGGDAAGTLFVASVSGAWQSEAVNNTTQSDTDSMTLTADFTASVGIKIIGQYVAFGLTIAEMTCKFADVFIQDQGSDVWIDDMYKIQTYGNASAMHGFNLATATQDVNIASTNNIALSAQQKLDVNTEADTAITDASLATAADLLDKLGAVNEAAATGDPSSTESVMQYVKQLVNVLVGTTGVTTFPSAAAPGNNVSLAEIIRAIYDDSNSLDGTKIPDTLSLANINAEVDTALDTAISELSQGIPTATPTVRTALMLMYMALRNKLDVATSGTDTLEIHNDAGTRISQKLLTDDGSDYSEAKMSSGA